MSAAALAAIFSKAQTHKRAHGKLCAALLAARRQALQQYHHHQQQQEQGSFFGAFARCVHRLLVVKQRAPAVERCIDFVVLFANACAREQAVLLKAAASPPPVRSA